MIVNVSYHDPEIQRKIDQAVGPSFTFKERWRMRGNGSPSLLIHKANGPIARLLPQDGRRNKCNIELRSEGIIVGFRVKLVSYAWVIPYYKLTLYKGRGGSILLFKDTVKMEVRNETKGERKFFHKLAAYKNEKSHAHPLND